MKMSRALLAFAAATALTCSAALPAAADTWTRGFVVSAYEYAFRYGGRPDFTRGGEIEPGVDCPRGSTTHFANPDQTRIALARQKWRSQQDIDWIAAPPGLDQVRDPGQVRRYIWRRALAYRGYKRGIETYTNPWAADDPGQPQVTSRIADGLNLDGNVGPNDFVSPGGEKGVDNALYRAWGCDAPWRGNGNAPYALAVRDSMLFGLYTMVLRVSGNQDPMNDSDATVEIGYSPDKIVRDSRGGIAADYSYRILKSTQYTKLKAKITNGAVETEHVEHLHMPRIAYVYHMTGDMDLTKGKMRLDIAHDGLSGTGLIGGYKNWRDLYAEAAFVNDGGGLDVTRYEDHVALYFALRRNADGMYNEMTGQYDGISTAFRIKMSSAFVVDPDKPMEIPIVAGEQWRMKGTEANKAAFIKGAKTRIPQNPPPGVSQTAAFPTLERAMKDLPSRDFFLTLDRPHWPDGVGVDTYGNPIDDDGDRIDSRGNKLDERGNPLTPPQPQHQVSNGAPATVATGQER
ncbi:hypothetical protein H8A95_24315 [Bradyrhizobium sp. Pear76]|uniref:hypothetical protein n=1 Tax=Bradyrhizobium oropedii TaxID=1571201 RepID=UPI001E38E9C8|nr:hypothetical protein [Bradyrhizobium oropedii]MCC8965354.1 hypothetical protein [Bradyrhizobium oropedii]